MDLADNTIVFFTGDNGGQDRFCSPEYPRGYFGPNVNPRTGVTFRGGKGNLYEGGLRIPFVVRWPGKIESGQVSDLLFYQPDVLPTLAELTGAKPPADIDGLSILPELLGDRQHQQQHDFLYWEFGSQVAVRKNQWKAIRPNKNAPWSLYDLTTDISETKSVAFAHRSVLNEMKAFAEQSHEPVRHGEYTDKNRTRHQRDRDAKWGAAGPPTTSRRKVHALRHKDLILAKNVKLVRFSSENKANDRLAAYTIDGDPRTVWHSEFTSKLARHPHEFVIDLGAEYKIQEFLHLPRQDSSWNGAFARTEFSVSNDPKRFRAPVARKTFSKLRCPQSVGCPTKTSGRYVRILSEVNKAAFASAAEIGIVGTRE